MIVSVRILGSSRADPGRIILLSKRVNRFVKALTKLSSPPRGNVELTGKWLAHGKQAR